MRNAVILVAAVVMCVSAYAQNVIISEINYNSAVDFDTEDWLEFYNNSEIVADMSGWLFKDSNDSNVFVFPDRTYLDVGEFLVLCRDTVAFKALFPEVSNIMGNIGFNLSNGGELIRLYDSTENVIDSLTYDDEPPWPLEPDGTGPTLELIDPDLPNEDPASWRASTDPHGSPGQDNGWSGIEDERLPGSMPGEFCLQPNYPNPFNPQTYLTFLLPKAGRVTLRVYNVAGSEVSRLADDWYTAGIYRVSFDASSLPSGVYLARLTAGEFQQTRKMLLIR